MAVLIGPSQIVIALQGGIGNQLFEWAFGVALADKGKDVVFDSVRCRGDRPLMVGPLINPGDRLAAPTGLALVAALKIGALRESPSLIRVVRQRRSGFDDSVVARLDGRSYVLGYFQSPRYFDGVADEVRARATELLESMLTPMGRELARELRSDETSVAVHVRRGDYVSDPSAAVRHGVLGGGYYARAIEYLESKGPRRIVWFGDDPQWIRENLARPDDTICAPEHTSADGGEIALMAACATRVIANSSFSWWAGWLGSPSTDRDPVIAPAAWFADEHSDAADLIPEDWLRL